jgi:hypothetical protein
MAEGQRHHESLAAVNSALVEALQRITPLPRRRRYRTPTEGEDSDEVDEDDETPSRPRKK